MAVQFYFKHHSISLTHRTRLKNFIAQVFRMEKKSFSTLTYVFCSDEEILKINQSYLKHDYYTDIITFNLSGPGEKLIGEIYISTDRVRENAIIHKTTIKEETHRVIFHGVLHLCGYRDKKGTDIKEMREKENYYLVKYFG